MGDSMTDMLLTIDDAKKLQDRYQKAVDDNEQEFYFKGKLLNTVYAGYMLEYIYGQMSDYYYTSEVKDTMDRFIAVSYTHLTLPTKRIV